MLCLSMACVVTSRGSVTLQLGSAVWGECALQPLLQLLPHQPPLLLSQPPQLLSQLPLLLSQPPQQQLPQLRNSVTPRLVTYALTISTASPGPAAVPTHAPPSLTGALSVREQVWLLEKPASVPQLGALETVLTLIFAWMMSVPPKTVPVSSL